MYSRTAIASASGSLRELLTKDLSKLNKNVLIDIIVTQKIPKDCGSDVTKKFLVQLFNKQTINDDEYHDAINSEIAHDVQNDHKNKLSSALDEVNYLKKEIHLINKLNGQMDLRIKDQELIIKLLQSRETQVTCDKVADKNQGRCDNKIPSSVNSGKKIDKPTNSINNDNIKTVVNPNGVDDVTNILDIKNRSKSVNNSEENDNSTWVEVVRKTKTLSSNKQNTDYKIKNFNNKRGERKFIEGCSMDQSLISVPKEKLSYFHVTRLDPKTTEDDVINAVKHKCEDVSCEKLKSKHPEIYSSFKITTSYENKDKILDPNLWKKGALIQRFFHKTPRQGQARTYERE